MLNVHELERAWLRYKLRRYLPLSILFLLVITFGIAAVFYRPAPIGTDQAASPVVPQPGSSVPAQPGTVPVQQSESVAVAKSPVSSPKVEAVPSAPSSAEPVSAHDEARPVVLEPSLNFMQNFDEPLQPVTPEAIAVLPDTQAEEAAPKIAVSIPESPAPVSKPAEKPKQESGHVQVTITEQDADDLMDVINRFRTNKNPALSLFLARRYYDLADYANAYEYALRTNELDSNIEESWLIFAKSMVKLGKKEQALSTLKSYVKYSSSSRAQALIQDITQGTFK